MANESAIYWEGNKAGRDDDTGSATQITVCEDPLLKEYYRDIRRPFALGQRHPLRELASNSMSPAATCGVTLHPAAEEVDARGGYLLDC